MATYNYTVTASGNSYYLWNGHGLVDAQNPDLFFRAGDSVTITNASSGGGHPMRITNNAAPSVGVINQSGGQIVVDPVSEGTFTYFCTSHPTAMMGAITVSAAYANEGPEDGYGTGPLIGHDAGPLSMNEIRTKINEIITKGGVGGTPGTGGGSISVSEDAPLSPSDGDLWWDSDTASLYVYFAERSAWIQTNGAVGGGAGNYESDWNSFPSYTNDSSGQSNNRAEYNFTHNLGSELLLVQLYIRKGSSGEVKLLDQAWGEISDVDLGWTFMPTNTTSGKIRFFEQILLENDNGAYEGEISSATMTTLQSSGYEFKIVASAGGGGGASGGGDASIEVSATAPDPAEDGDLWFNTTQAELYVYVDAESAWIQTNGGGGSGGGNFSTGWVNTDGTTAVDNGADLNFNHNLGTTDLTFAVYVADDAYGTNATLISTVDTRVNPYVWTGAQVQNLTTTSFRLRLGGGQHNNNQSGYSYLYSPTGGQNPGESYTGKYIKVVASAGVLAGPRAYVAFDGTSSNLTDSITNSFNVSSLVDKGVGWYEVNFTSPVNNPVPTTTVESPSSTNPHDSSVYNVTANGLEIIAGFTALNGSGRLDRAGVFLVVH